MRNFLPGQGGRIKPHDLAFQNIQPPDPAELDTLRKQNLHPHTDAEKRRAPLNHPVDGIDQAACGQAIHARPKRAHPRQDNACGRLNLRGIPGDGGGVARFFKALLDTAQIAHAVINNRDHSGRPLLRSDWRESRTARLVPVPGRRPTLEVRPDADVWRLPVAALSCRT